MVWIRNMEEYPKVWLRFESEKCGQKFIVKDLSPEYYDISLGYMTNIFMEESAICKPLNILHDPVSRREMQDKWLSIMAGNMALVCVTDEALPRVAGVHLTLVREKSQQGKEKLTDNAYGQFTRRVQQLKNEGDLFHLFGDQYLGSLGLLVLPEYRGQGIATHMLAARLRMCRSLGLRGTATVFSTRGAQAAAARAGYRALTPLGDRALTPRVDGAVVMGAEA